MLLPLLVMLAAEPLTVRDAVTNALAKHPAIEAGAAAEKAAGARVAEARGAALPRVSYSEVWMRSNNPVFVFGSLLNQRQFAASNFDLNFLNDPPFLNNFQSQVTAEQMLYDGGARKARVEAAERGRGIAGEENRKTEMQVIAGVLRSYYSAAAASERIAAADEALRLAEADLKRAEARLGAGVTTSADVLSMKVHLAAMRERRIRQGFELEAARAELNQAMGLPLDTAYTLSSTLQPVASAELKAAAAEQEAVGARPELRQARLAVEAGELQGKMARAALLPEVFLRAGFEADRERFITRGGANWLASAGLRWTLFSGGSDRARIEEVRQETAKAAAQARLAESYIRLDVRRSVLELQSATERIAVAHAAIEMAQEGLRIVRNRYESGLTDVTELLRAETAVVEARTNELEAIRGQILAAVALEAARGQLTRASELANR